MDAIRVAIEGDPISGTTAGEHHRHTESPHPPLPLTGYIDGKCSTKVFINGIPVALVGSTTEETDGCCAGDNSGGEIVSGYSKVKIEGRAIAMVGSKVDPHNGTASVAGSQQNLVWVGGA